MKRYLLLLLVLLATSQAFAKKNKKDDQAVIDSLSKANVLCDSLNKVGVFRYDSVSQELKDIYIIIKEKVVKKDFDMTRLPYITDSLIALRDSSFSRYHMNAATLMDSLTILRKENSLLKTTLNGMTAEEASKNRLANELRQLKSLLDSHIITKSEFDAKKIKLLEKWQ